MSVQSVCQIHPAAALRKRGEALPDTADAVYRQRVEPLGESGLTNLPRADTTRDEVIQLVIHFEEFHDGHASVIALMVAGITTGGAIQSDVLVGRNTQQFAFRRIGLVG